MSENPLKDLGLTMRLDDLASTGMESDDIIRYWRIESPNSHVTIKTKGIEVFRRKNSGQVEFLFPLAPCERCGSTKDVTTEPAGSLAKFTALCQPCWTHLVKETAQFHAHQEQSA